MLPLKKTPPTKPLAKDQTAPEQPPASASTELVPAAKKSSGAIRVAPTPTLKQSLLTSVQNFEANNGWENLPMQTPSGNNFGSEKNYAMDWTTADVGEVSSQSSASPHPSSGSMVAKTLHTLQIATLKASQTAMVSTSDTSLLSISLNS